MIIFEIGGVLASEHALHIWKSWVVGEEEILRLHQDLGWGKKFDIQCFERI